MRVHRRPHHHIRIIQINMSLRSRRQLSAPISSLDGGFDSASDSDLGDATQTYSQADSSSNAGSPPPRRTRWCGGVATFVLLIGALGCFVDLVFSWTAALGAVFSALKDSENVSDTGVLCLGACRVFHIIFIYGTMATLIPKRELHGPRRKALMATQGGHTLMLTYFLGFGAIAEVVRDCLCKMTAGLREGKYRVRTAVVFHGFVFALPQLLMNGFSLHLASADIAKDIASTNLAAVLSSAVLLTVGLAIYFLLPSSGEGRTAE